MEDVIEDQYGKVWYEDGIMCAYYNKGVVVNEEIARSRVKYRLMLSKGEPVPALIYAENVVYWTREGKRYANSKESLEGITAGAILNKNKVFNIILKAGMLLFPPSVPIKIFSDEEKARDWLKSFL